MMDKTLDENSEKALLLEADELFNVVFKITYYDDPETAICNTPLDSLVVDEKPQTHAILLTNLEEHVLEKSKINVVISNILIRHLDTVRDHGTRDHKMRLLISLAEFIHSSPSMISTRRLARIVYYLGMLYARIETLQ